jgi:hypothetical protein
MIRRKNDLVKKDRSMATIGLWFYAAGSSVFEDIGFEQAKIVKTDSDGEQCR